MKKGGIFPKFAGLDLSNPKAAVPHLCLCKLNQRAPAALRSLQINGVAADALVDTGSTLSHLSERFVKVLDLKLQKRSHCGSSC